MEILREQFLQFEYFLCVISPLFYPFCNKQPFVLFLSDVLIKEY